MTNVRWRLSVAALVSIIMMALQIPACIRFLLHVPTYCVSIPLTLPFNHYQYIVSIDSGVIYCANILIYSLMAALLCFLFSWWMSIPFACLGSLACATFPDFRWLRWPKTAQYLWALFFIMLAWFVYKKFLLSDGSLTWAKYGTGFLFFLSLLSHKSNIFVALIFFMWAYLFYTNVGDSFVSRILKALSFSWFLFAVQLFYIAFRVMVFGWSDLVYQYSVWCELQAMVADIVYPALVGNVSSYLTYDGSLIFKNIFNEGAWLVGTVIGVPIATLFQRGIAWFLFIGYFVFLGIAYHKNRMSMIFLIGCMITVVFPVLWMYPFAALYMLYPLIFFGFSEGCYLLWHDTECYWWKKVLIPMIMSLLCIVVVHRMTTNLHRLTSLEWPVGIK